ncbi:MAG TPA: DegV family protein [Caldilineae bacterium]|nr:DegV family protein [Caldilineae bacterium]
MVRIVTDSTSDIPEDLAKELDIQIVPLRVIFGEEVLLDRIDISSDAFFERLKSSPTLPTTSQPPPADFLKVFEEAIREGDEVVCIVISSDLSGTYESAIRAKETLGDVPITVIDSRITSMGLGLAVEEAARMAKAGATRQEIAQRIEKLLPKISVLFVVDTLEYLQKGGRIGGAQALVGTLLRIKPLLTLRGGRVDLLERVRTRRKAIDRMIEIAAQRAQAAGCPHRVGVLHAQAPNEAEYIAQQARERLDCEHLLLSQIGPVLGTHVGPGTVGIAMMPMLPEEG